MRFSSCGPLATVAAVMAAAVLALTSGGDAASNVTRAAPVSAPLGNCGAVSCTIHLPGVFLNYPPPLALEVTQAVQTPDNSVTLVADRTTFARLTITSAVAHTNVSAWLHGARNGSPLPGSPIAALNNPRTLESSANRATLGDTFNFRLPPSWTNGTIDLSAHASNSSTFTFEGGPRAFPFVRSDPLHVTVVPIAYTCTSGGSGTTTPAAPYAYLTDLTYRMFPAPSISTSTHAAIPHSGPCSGGQPDPAAADWQSMLYKVTDAREADGALDSYYYGLVNVYCGGGCISGMGWIGWPVATGFDGLNALHAGASETHAHEAAHNLGRYHAPGCGVTDPDPSYPYYSGGASHIGNTAHPNYGFDILTQAVHPYTGYYDITGYCEPPWISDYTYKGLLSWRQSQSAAGLTVVQDGRAMLISGEISTGKATFRPVYVLDALRAVRLPDPGEYTLELLGAGGQVVGAYPFAPARAIADRFQAGTAFEAVGFHMTLPYSDSIQSIRVRRGDSILSALVAGAQPPSLVSASGTLMAESGAGADAGADAVRVGWSANLAQGETLHYLVRASTDAGATWQTVGVNSTTPWIDLRSEDFGGRRVWVEIIASSGLRSTSLRAGPFTVPAGGP